ncbi:MAG: hypothetical protein ACOCYZ_03800 [Halococcoides sp.]
MVAGRIIRIPMGDPLVAALTGVFTVAISGGLNHVMIDAVSRSRDISVTARRRYVYTLFAFFVLPWIVGSIWGGSMEVATWPFIGGWLLALVVASLAVEIRAGDRNSVDQ